jgi:hypothetical protein
LLDSNPRTVDQVTELGTASFIGAKNWRAEDGLIPKVSDQGKCSAGWAFAGSEVMAVNQVIDAGVSERADISVSMVRDCASPKYGGAKCSGGPISSAIAFIYSYGASKNSDYPYVDYEQSCYVYSNRAIQISLHDYGHNKNTPISTLFTFLDS